MKKLVGLLVLSMTMSSLHAQVANTPPENLPEAEFRECEIEKDLLSKIHRSSISDSLHCLQIRMAGDTELDQETKQLIQSLTSLNFVLTGDPSFSQANRDALIQLLTVINIEAIQILPLFENKDPVSAELAEAYRARIKRAGLTISHSLKNLYSQSPVSIKMPELIKGWMMGIQKEELSSTDVAYLIQNLPEILLLKYEIAQNRRIKRDQLQDLFSLSRNVEVLQQITHPGNNQTFEKISLSELKKLMVIRDSVFDSLLSVILPKQDLVSTKDFNVLLQHLSVISKKGILFHRFYSALKPLLDSPRSLAQYRFDELRNTYPDARKEVEEFSRIAAQYKLFKGKQVVPDYGNAYKRSPEGMVEVGMVNYISKLESFGDILPGQEKVRSLFQMDAYSSEKAELVISHFSAKQLTSSIADHLESACGESSPFSQDCVNEHYMSVLCESTGESLKDLCSSNSALKADQGPFGPKEIQELTLNTLQAESLFKDMDVDLNEQLDHGEVKSLYKKIGAAFNPGDEVPEQFHRHSFNFFVKNGRLPTSMELIKFTLSPGVKLQMNRERLLEVLNFMLK